MTGAEPGAYGEIATNCVAGVAAQAVSSIPSTSSTTAKSAVSALSEIATRTVASDGSSVKLTWRSACQGTDAIWTVLEPIARQGRMPGENSTRARIAAAIRGAAEIRIFKRNMHKLAQARSGTRRVYGWQSVKKTRYRLVDMIQITSTQLTPTGSRYSGQAARRRSSASAR